MEDLQEYLSHFKKSPEQENEISSNLTKRALGSNRLKSHNLAKDKIMKRMKNELEVRLIEKEEKKCQNTSTSLVKPNFKESRRRQFEPFFGYTQLSPTEVRIKKVQPRDSFLREEVERKMMLSQNRSSRNKDESSHRSLEKFSLTPQNRLLNVKLVNFSSHHEKICSEPSNFSIKKRKKKYGLSDSRKAKSSYNNKPVLISNGLIAVSNKIEGKHPKKKKFVKKDKGIKMSYSPINQNHDFDNDYLEQDMKNLDEPNKEPPITLLPLSFSPNSSAFLKFRKV
ncbi:unnamed protein product [Moneuplotes crassus]|uniref:Uncharacterized protein n=1 Tax=Euplotes crassus TaxID=5936 RepID=A0AAD2D3D1_EUPCR|nr:unnamed protein product [Moneuplotes crassus]